MSLWPEYAPKPCGETMHQWWRQERDVDRGTYRLRTSLRVGVAVVETLVKVTVRAVVGCGLWLRESKLVLERKRGCRNISWCHLTTATAMRDRADGLASCCKAKGTQD